MLAVHRLLLSSLLLLLSLPLQVEYVIRVQLLEIYNEQLRDLLADAEAGGPQRLDIRNTAASGLNVPDARQVPSP